MAVLSTPQLPTRSALAAPALVAAGALALGYLAVARPVLAVVLLGLALLVPVLMRPQGTAALLGLSVPLVMDVSGGAVGLQVAPSDLVLTAMAVGVLARWVVRREAPELAVLRPLRWIVLPYLAVMVVLLAAHPSGTSVVASLQRVELMVFPLVVGAALALRGHLAWFLGAYLVSATAVAALWLAGVPMGQKNPIGQFIANGLILVVAVPSLRKRFWPAVPVLVAGVLFTGSRGSILSVLIALVVLVLVTAGRPRWRTLALVVPVAVIAYGAFQLLPEDLQQRNLTYSTGTANDAERANYYREQQHNEARVLIDRNPWLGVGVGGYQDGDGYYRPTTADPHQVLLFEWAQGGYPLLAAFLVLMLTPVVVVRAARRTPLGPAAAATSAAIMGHGLVDVYWVRGTPLLGWVLVGMALAQAAVQRDRPEVRV